MQIIAARFVIVAASLALAGVGPAYSQGAAPRRPSGGLFGATRSDVGGSNRLNFMFQIAESVDSELPPDVASQLSRGLDSGGLSTMLQASSNYARGGRRLQLAGNASTAFRYYQNLDRLEAVSHSVGLGASVRVPKGTLRIDQSAAYSPSYLYQLFPIDSAQPLGASIPANPEYQIAETESYSYRTTAALLLGSPRGTQVTMSGAFNRTDFQKQLRTRADLEITETGVKVAHRFAPSRAVTGGYDFREGEFGFDGPTKEHRLTLGVEYAPALSRTRRASFRLNLMPTQLYLPASAISDDLGETNAGLLRLSGEAAVSYPFKLNWRADARYRRSVEYLSILSQPVLSDAGRLEVAGLLARPLDLALSGGYATAASALDRTGRNLQTYTGQVTLRYALKRSFALYSEYMYYYYDLRGQALLAAGLPAVFEQHGFRLGASVFLEALGR